MTGRTVTLKVKYADFQQITRSRTNERGLRGVEELVGIASVLLEPLFPVKKGVRLLGATLSSLEPERDEDDTRQLSLGLPGQ
ncbi:hypothetical protein [Paracoccus alcaliphilus]|uniref:DinB/UmuC family translesion DNA polymerase n=1 Tax=Paracoccus alcaliphilus TaxID=34002 RepID=UPI000B83762D|nr:hypothetical protein [Paracoccus alcaliphilus]